MWAAYVGGFRAMLRRWPLVLVLWMIGTAFGLLSPNLLDQYAAFMGWIGTGFLPIAAITVVHFFVFHRGAAIESRAWSRSALLAWVVGVACCQAVLRFAPQIRNPVSYSGSIPATLAIFL